MCGIAGIFRRGGSDDADPSRLVAMTDAIVHRGPDDFGYLTLSQRTGDYAIGQDVRRCNECNVLLGNRRLTIVDLSAKGRQPIANETRDVFITFNGEIYNHHDLRRELLDRGHIFESATDTEVIVHAYEEWGEECVARFNGMWAFAIWDQRQRQLFCSRDRFGIKPFYYRLDADVFWFASEIKGILAALSSRPSANLAVVRDYLVTSSLCQNPETFFENILRLEPGHNLVISDLQVVKKRYWDYNSHRTMDRRDDPAEAFRALLDDAVRLRFSSEVPVGLALSGGLDSTAILGVASALAPGQRIKTFSAVFSGFGRDEAQFSALAAQRLDAVPHTIEYKTDDLAEDLERLVWHLDYPALVAQVLPRWHIIQRARQHVKVLLEGQGADEILAGYIHRYFEPYLLDQFRSLRARPTPKRLSTVARTCSDLYRAAGAAPFRSLLAHSRFFPYRLYASMRPLNRAFTGDFLNVRGLVTPWKSPRTGPFNSFLDNALHYDHSRAILPQLLKFGDAISMAGSVESRLPFMDHRIVEFAFQLPSREKLNGDTSKCVLRNACADVMPKEILERRDKIGFGTPSGPWFRECMDTLVRPILLSRQVKDRGILDTGKVEKLLTSHAQHRTNIGDSIFRWLSVELWFRLFIDGNAEAPGGGNIHRSGPVQKGP